MRARMLAVGVLSLGIFIAPAHAFALTYYSGFIDSDSSVHNGYFGSYEVQWLPNYPDPAYISCASGSGFNNPQSITGAVIGTNALACQPIITASTSAHVVVGGNGMYGNFLGTIGGNDWIDLGAIPSGASSVLFLPGLQASRLYDATGNQIWAPNLAGNDISNLDLTNPSATDGVYTKSRDVIDIAYSVYKVYDSFISNMDALKAQGTINDWEPIAYDWRLDYQDLLNYGHETSSGRIYYRGANAATTTDPYIAQELKRLAAGSKTGKVTIVTHSNGGLLAKAIMMRPSLAQYVDKLIFVAVPQLGTPKAIGGLLHGFDQGLPLSNIQTFLSDADARYLGLNMPSTYNLLPSNQYFASVDDPVVSFDPVTMPDWITAYGVAGIHSTDRLKAFMIDVSRGIPAYNNVDAPAIALSNLFDAAVQTHASLDAWIPPAGVQLTTVAGWGNETLSGITYRRVLTKTCTQTNFFGLCISYSNGTKITFDPDFVIDGDDTVVAPSALWASGTTPARYWVNLTSSGADHAQILRLSSLLSFINNLVSGSSTNQIPPGISNSQPTYSGNISRLHFVLHSPLTLGFTDSSGNYTGATATTTIFNIRGVAYERFGDVQWLSIPENLSGQIVMHGLAPGSFSLDIEEVDGNTTLGKTSFEGIPSNASTTASVAISPTQSATASSVLVVDFNGDGNPDYNLNAKLNGVVLLPNPLTITADNKTAVLGSSMPPLTANLSGFVNGDTLATSDVAGAPLCATTATTASLVGTYPISCTTGTLSSANYSFDNFVPGTLTILYRFDGFLQPINDTAHQAGQSLSVFKAGSTVPVKLQLKRANGTPVQAGNAPQWLTPQKGAAMAASIDESTYSDPGSTGASFKWDSTSQQYVYNWNTKGLSAGYWYKVSVKLDDGTTRSVTVGLK